MNLQDLRKILKNNKPNYPLNYTIPAIFNTFSYKKGVLLNNGELLVNPYDFLINLLDTVFLNSYVPLETKSLSKLNLKEKHNNGKWIKRSVLYSILIRSSSAWDHDRNNILEINNMYNLRETGTFLKTIILLPYLKNLGVNTLYLLPITKYSRRNKKGDLGSPYSVSNFFSLDDELSDPMVNDDITLDEQFKLLVEAAHVLKIRVIIDIIPRTNAIENDLIKDYPNWFYWIKTKDLENYGPPKINELKNNTIAPSLEVMKTVYNNKNAQNHINLFKENPKEINKEKWQLVLTEHKSTKESILKLIDKHFGLTIAPAFSDHINDNQPAWTDITFFRLYFDHPTYTKKYLKNINTPPYILFDTIKANVYPGVKPNKELWKLLSDVIPYFQKTFGIDGARIDMGHALPKELINMIIHKAKEIDENFCFIAEELNPDNSNLAKASGYNMIIGNSFMMLWDIENKKTQEFIETQHEKALPSFAAAETHDTPRIAARDGGKSLARLLTIVNMFIPNTVPFINSGQEIFEQQPINLGIDPREKDLYMLPKTSPYYKKLALFDKYAFDYINKENHILIEDLKKISLIRSKYLNSITKTEKYFKVDFTEGDNIIGIGYHYKNEFLFIIGNLKSYAQHVKLNLSVLQKEYKLKSQGLLLFATHEKEGRIINEFDENKFPYFLLGPNEVKIFKIKKDE